MTRADFSLIERMLVLGLSWSKTTIGHENDRVFMLAASAAFREEMEALRGECEDGPPEPVQ